MLNIPFVDAPNAEPPEEEAIGAPFPEEEDEETEVEEEEGDFEEDEETEAEEEEEDEELIDEVPPPQGRLPGAYFKRFKWQKREQLVCSRCGFSTLEGEDVIEAHFRSRHAEHLLED